MTIPTYSPPNGDLPQGTIVTPQIWNSNFDGITSFLNNTVVPALQAASTVSVSGLAGLCNMRAGLTSGTPLTDVASGATLYLTPFNGNGVACYDAPSNSFIPRFFTEISIAGNTTNFPTAGVYDIPVYWNGSAVVADTPVVWSTNTTVPATRSTVQGVLCINNANTSRVIASVYWNGTNFIDMPYYRGICNVGAPVFRLVAAACNNSNIAVTQTLQLCDGTTTLTPNTNCFYVLLATAQDLLLGLTSSVQFQTYPLTLSFGINSITAGTAGYSAQGPSSTVVYGIISGAYQMSGAIGLNYVGKLMQCTATGSGAKCNVGPIFTQAYL